MNSRPIILCYKTRWVSQTHFKLKPALPPKPAFLHQTPSSSCSGPRPWSRLDFSLSPTTSNPSTNPVGFNFRVDSCLCPSLLSLAQATSTYCLDGGKCLLKRSPYSQQVPHTVYVYHSSQGDPMKTRVTTHFCAEPSSDFPRAQSRSPGPVEAIFAPSPQPRPLLNTELFPPPDLCSQGLSVLFPLCSLLYPQHLRGKLGTPSTQ